MKIFVVMALLLLSFVGYVIYEQYRYMEATRMQLLKNEGRSLSNFTEAFREVYQNAFAENHVRMTQDTIVFLPVLTIDSIAQRLSKKVNGTVQIRTVSDRPRNERNRANPLEQKQIDYFKKHPSEEYRVLQEKGAYYYFRPLRITQTCMKCHGKREEAPRIIREHYAAAYNYHIGDLRGLSSVKITHHQSFGVLMERFKKFALTVVVLYLLILAAFYWLLRRLYAMEYRHAEELKHKVAETTEALQRQKEMFETLFEKSSDGIIILDEGRVIQCNEKAGKLFRHIYKAQLLDKTLMDLSPERQLDGVRSSQRAEHMVKSAYTHGYGHFEWVFMTRDGEAFVTDVTLTPIELEGRKVLHMVLRDISDKKMAEEKMLEQKKELQHQANHDALTGLPNRTLLLDRLKQGIRRAQRTGSHIAVLFIDVDHFKKINDTLGHHIGDRILIEVSQRLGSIIRSGDTLARLGGDEFTIMSEGDADDRFSTRIAEGILHQLSQPFLIDGHTLYVSASVGISLYPKDATTVGDLLKFADAAMYTAKTQGRNAYRYYSPEMTQILMERVTLEGELRHAIERNEFVIYFQPQFALKTGRISGMEALVRWHHPERGLILPDEFIPLAEENGMIVEIDRWVMRSAMQQFREWKHNRLDPGILSLNLSVRQLMNDTFAQSVLEIMQEEGFEPEWLELEITEREMMRDPEKSIACLRTLNGMGISIAVDDFGTGYSSLAYLKSFPLHRLKIDRSFVQGIPDDPEDTGIAKAIITLAESLELDIIAEGVETQAQADFLLAHDCHHVQGYFFGKPIPGESMGKKLASQ